MEQESRLGTSCPPGPGQQWPLLSAGGDQACEASQSVGVQVTAENEVETVEKEDRPAKESMKKNGKKELSPKKKSGKHGASNSSSSSTSISYSSDDTKQTKVKKQMKNTQGKKGKKEKKEKEKKETQKKEQ